MKLSVILIAHNMAREIPRSLQSLARDYQIDAVDLDYEVILIDNGSTAPLGQEVIAGCGPHFRYFYLDNPPPSPAYAINFGVRESAGEIICLMIDGAHILTPGVFSLALRTFLAFANPIVATRYFYLGPGAQNDTMLKGYNQAAEDALLERIKWPSDGYRLFEIGVPLQHQMPKITWFNKMIESNCLFLRRESFDRCGGADERFDMPGGGFLNIDIFAEANRLPDATPVQLIGEGSFHQIHGGATTNVKPEERDDKVARYLEQYQMIRRHSPSASEKDVFYIGHLPTLHSKIHLKQEWGRLKPVSENLRNSVLGKPSG